MWTVDLKAGVLAALKVLTTVEVLVSWRGVLSVELKDQRMVLKRVGKSAGVTD